MLGFLALLVLAGASTQEDFETRTAPAEIGRERFVIQTSFGDLRFGLFPALAPVTAAHIRRLFELGAYNTNHIFRVDAGFVAQVAAISGGRKLALNAEQRAEESQTVPLEASPERARHDRRGLLSMARHADPASGTSSFSIMLGPAPHLDGEYTIFGELVDGFETLAAIEQVEVVREGMFVMPKKRITIHSTYVYIERGESDGRVRLCTDEYAAAAA